MKRLVLALVVVCSASALFAESFPRAIHGKPEAPLNLRLQLPAERFAGGEIISPRLQVEFGEAVEAILLEVAAEGVVAESPFKVKIDGPWAAGQTHVIPLRVRVLGLGEGSLKVGVEVLNAQDEVLYGRATALYVLAEKDRIWASASSPIQARLMRIEDLSSNSPELRRRMIDEQVTRSLVLTDHTPTPVRELSAAERELQKLFEPYLRTSQVRTTAIGPAGATTFTVTGKISWTDSASGVHGVPLATVEIWDDDSPLSPDLITTVSTDAAGNFTAAVSYDDGVLQGNPDVYIRVYARSPVGDIKPDTASATTYSMQSAVQNEVPAGSSPVFNLTANNTDDNQTAFGVHHAMVVIGGYAGSLAGTMPSQVDTRFPTTRSTSLFSSSASQLHLLRADRFDWDVIHHEYGHYFANTQSFAISPGGTHGFGQNLASAHGKDHGTRLAFGEGWPTFFGISGQQMTGTAALGIPNVGDTRYQDTEDATVNLNLETSTGVGEDNEVSVMAMLWDLFDAANDGKDKSAFSDRTLFGSLKGASASRAASVWLTVTAGRTPEQITILGGLFGQANIAPVLLTPADKVKIKTTDPLPMFSWQKNGGGVPNPLNDFKIKFYKHNFSSVIFEKALGNTDRFTPTAPELATILAGDNNVRWVVEGKNTAAPPTPGAADSERYWSDARTIGPAIRISFVIDDTGSMGEEIAGVRAALQDFIDHVSATLTPGQEPPVIQLLTFKDEVTERIVSGDLAAVRAAVGALVADGCDDCPEVGPHALQKAAETISPGGTILFATDASPQPGVDMGAVITLLRAKGVTVNTLLSGDCDGISSKPFGRANALSASGPQRRRIRPNSIGSEPQMPITDPGQATPDDHGDSPATATRLLVGAEPVRGSVGVGLDTQDYFIFTLESSVRYTILIGLELFLPETFTLLDRDGVTELRSGYADFGERSIEYVPSIAGDYFLRVSTGPFETPYLVSVLRDTFAGLDSALELYSTVSAQTGGAFLVRDDVNVGQTREYEAAMFNVMVSSLGPAVLGSIPDDLSRASTLSILMTGRGTNWRANSTVHFSSPGIVVEAVSVTSATTLLATVRIDAAATLGYSPVEVHTVLGSSTEVARGRDVVEIVEASAAPAILSVEPASVTQGRTQSIVIRGINTAWTSSVSVDLGEGIVVESKTVSTPTRIDATIRVSLEASIGYRSATITGPSTFETKSRALFVGSSISVVPEIVSVSPAVGILGQTIDLAVEGSNTHFAAATTTASLGDGITVLSVMVTDEQRAIVRISISPSAATGFRDVSLTTGSEVAVALNGFFVASALARGDVNGDGALNANDVIYLLRHLFGGGAAPIGPSDVNNNGQLDIADVFQLLNHLFFGTAL